MSRVPVTREQFQDAIEVGIAASASLSNIGGYNLFDPAPVRLVGQTAEVAAVGEYTVDGCQCPISQAYPYPAYLRIYGDITFATNYDSRMRAITGRDGAFVVQVAA